MTQLSNTTADHTNTGSNSINVAIAVISHGDQYLLGFRNSTQHQGNRYEFVGGKIEAHESAVAALIREVGEETGLDICDNTIVKLGRLHHDYGDVQVHLHVYAIEVFAAQYQQQKHQKIGLEGQKLTWVPIAALLNHKYPLPAANQTILSWLQLPAQLSITYPLAPFIQTNNPTTAWLDYHKKAIKKDAWVYVRTKADKISDSPDGFNGLDSRDDSLNDNCATMIDDLITLRPDIRVVLPYKDSLSIDLKTDAITKKIKARHINHAELMQWNNNPNDSLLGRRDHSSTPLAALPLIVSCHDKASISAANKLAKARLTHQQSAVIGMFLSPVLPTATHPDAPALGWGAWSDLADLADMPVIALGGLSPDMIKEAARYGGASIAGIRQFLAK